MTLADVSTCSFPQRQGRSDTFATEYDLEAEEYVPLPKGDVHKKKEVIQDVTLHDLDIANARPQVRCRVFLKAPTGAKTH